MRTTDPARTQERCTQIREAALACFREKGFHGAAMSAICKRARMSPGHLYHYFKSKEDLIEAIIVEENKHSETRIRELLGGDDTLESMIASVGEIWTKCDEGFHGALDAEIMAEASRNDRIAKMICDRENLIRNILVEIIGAAQERGNIDKTPDPEGFATLMIGVITGLTIADDANAGVDRDKAVEAVRFMLRRCLQPVN